MTLVAEPLTTISITPLESPEPSPYQKLAEAIERGSLRHPQGIGLYYESGRTCALGAAYVGMGGNVEETYVGRKIVQMMLDLGLLSASAIHPIDGGRDGLMEIIVDLNDTHGWSREWIATWLRSLW